MKIIKLIKEKEKKDKEYMKEIHEVQKKYGKYRSKPKRFIIELAFLVSLVITAMTIPPMYAFQKIIEQNEYIINLEKNKGKILSEFDEVSYCQELEDNIEKRECFLNLMDNSNSYLIGLVASNVAYLYSVENNDVELAKDILNNIKKLNTSRHYEDLNADFDIELAFNIIDDSLMGKLLNISNYKFKVNMIEQKNEFVKKIEDKIREEHNLHDYKAFID